MTVIYPTPALPKWNSGSGEVWIHRVAVGSGLRATVDMARPTKEDKIRRKAKPQRRSDKERAGGDRRDHDGIGRLTDARKSQIQKENFGQPAARIEREAPEGWKPQKVWGGRGMLQSDDDRDRPGPSQSQTAASRMSSRLSPANHNEQHRTSYQHDLYQRGPLIYKHISHASILPGKPAKGRLSSKPC